MSLNCKHPERCGSDGESCCHPDCPWAEEPDWIRQAEQAYMRSAGLPRYPRTKHAFLTPALKAAKETLKASLRRV